jgi:hypothetical protein
MNCGPFIGVTRTAATKPSPDMKITYLAGAASAFLPAHIAGPVIETARTVEIRYANGDRSDDFLRELRRVETNVLQRLRCGEGRNKDGVRSLRNPVLGYSSSPWAGLDEAGNVVACLVPNARPENSPLSDCL